MFGRKILKFTWSLLKKMIYSFRIFSMSKSRDGEGPSQLTSNRAATSRGSSSWLSSTRQFARRRPTQSEGGQPSPAICWARIGFHPPKRDRTASLFPSETDIPLVFLASNGIVVPFLLDNHRLVANGATRSYVL